MGLITLNDGSLLLVVVQPAFTGNEVHLKIANGDPWRRLSAAEYTEVARDIGAPPPPPLWMRLLMRFSMRRARFTDTGMSSRRYARHRFVEYISSVASGQEGGDVMRANQRKRDMLRDAGNYKSADDPFDLNYGP